MSREDRIADLLASADALRPLHEDDPKKLPLAELIDRINALRKEQEDEAHGKWIGFIVAANAPGSEGLTDAILAISAEKDAANEREHEAEFAEIAASVTPKRKYTRKAA